ncbi:MAG: hypothetical protein R2851_04420 [Caldilineaceae bacterium]
MRSSLRWATRSVARRLANIQTIQEQGLVDNAAHVGAHLHEKLVELQAKHPPSATCAGWA